MKFYPRAFLPFIVAFLCETVSISAQPFLQSWVQVYNGPHYDDDLASAIAVDGNGNVFVTGKSTFNTGTPQLYDYATIAYSSGGVPLWTNVYHDPSGGSSMATAIAVDTNGNVFVTGAATPVLNYDYGTIAYSNSGIPLWTNFYSGPANGVDIALAIALDANGNVFVTGRSPGAGTSYDFATIAYSGAGTPLWTNRYDGPGSGDDTARAIAVDSQGKVFVTGNSAGTNSIATYATVAYSNSGLPLWTNRYDGGYGQPAGIAVDTNGNVIVTGHATPTTVQPTHSEYVTIKYSNDGFPLWTNFYNGPAGSNDYATSLAVDSAGNVVVTGYSTTRQFIPNGYNYATVKYSSAGVPLWTNLYIGPVDDDQASAVRLDSNGNVFVTGNSYGPDNDPHCATIAYSGAGVPLWTNRFVSFYRNTDVASAMALDNKGNVDIAGYTYGFLNDYLILQYSAAQPIPLGIEQISNQIVLTWTNAGFSLQSAPSPAGVYTNVPSAISPYTNALSSPQQFYRLIVN